MVKRRTRRITRRNAASSSATKKPTQALAIAALILNALILPGLGTIVGGRTREGIIQLVLFLVGIPLIFVIVGIPLVIGVWIWALVTSIRLIKESG